MADRHAILVDAGYLFASVAELVAGSTGRHLIEGDLSRLVKALTAKVAESTSLPLLRTYWYDASLTGQPEHDQQVLADEPGVRLRLGRLVRSEQKGVDSRLVRDLIVLARDRAVVEIHLVAGDEDLVEGVAEAQDAGVRVALIGVPGINQSLLLRQQADARCELPAEFWTAHFHATARAAAAACAPTEPPRARRQPPPNASMVAAFEAAVARHPEAAALLRNGEAEVDEFAAQAKEAGGAFARELLENATPVDIDRLLQFTGWQVPTDLDVQLLRFTDHRIGNHLWERPELKPIVRNTFWEVFRELAPRRRETAS